VTYPQAPKNANGILNTTYEVMIESAKNKAIAADPNSVGDVTVTAHSLIQNAYHFAGAPDYRPLTVVATTIEDATEIWKLKRVPVDAVTETQTATVSNEQAPAVGQEKTNDAK
jgi:hypothetical protein